MDYPIALKPTGFLELDLSAGKLVSVPVARIEFSLWRGGVLTDGYNKKTVLDHRGQPLFAELVILRHLEEAGWEGRWVDTYKRRYLTDWIKEVELPSGNLELLERIYKRAGLRRGCFDVFCWRKDATLFVESKRHGKDHLRFSQKNWLNAALAIGLPMESFLIVEWTLKSPSQHNEY